MARYDESRGYFLRTLTQTLRDLIVSQLPEGEDPVDALLDEIAEKRTVSLRATIIKYFKNYSGPPPEREERLDTITIGTQASPGTNKLYVVSLTLYGKDRALRDQDLNKKEVADSIAERVTLDIQVKKPRWKSTIGPPEDALIKGGKKGVEDFFESVAMPGDTWARFINTLTDSIGRLEKRINETDATIPANADGLRDDHAILDRRRELLRIAERIDEDKGYSKQPRTSSSIQR